MASTRTIGGNFTIAAGTTLTIAAGRGPTVTGTTSVSGTLSLNVSTTRTSTFNGDIIINSGGTWTGTTASPFTIAGNLQNNGTFTGSNAATSGVYTIDPDGTAGTQAATTCYCDMTTDGGGWTLVLNYLHAGGATPALVTKTTALPLQGSTTLGTDESASATTWGHVSNAYLNSFTFSELRFYGATNAHSRIINFKTTHSGTINYFKTGSGSMTGIASSYTALSGHTAYLPASTASYFTDQGNAAMTEFPFWLGGTYHWGIRGSAYRWEVDDFNNSYNYHTFHQIWIR